MNFFVVANSYSLFCWREIKNNSKCSQYHIEINRFVLIFTISMGVSIPCLIDGVRTCNEFYLLSSKTFMQWYGRYADMHTQETVIAFTNFILYIAHLSSQSAVKYLVYGWIRKIDSVIIAFSLEKHHSSNRVV